MESAAAGLAGFGFWMFIAAVVVAGIWYDVRKKESQQETLRRVVESGKPIDKELLDLLLDKGYNKDLVRDLKLAALIVLFVAPGLAILGWFLSRMSEQVLYPLLGISFLVGFVGAGLWIAAKFVERQQQDDLG